VHDTRRKKLDLERMTNPSDLDLMRFRPTIFHPVRFLIMKTLAGDMSVDFRELRQALGRSMPSGNLASHLRALEKEKYVTFQKRIEGHRVLTGYALTPHGLEEYERLRTVLTGWIGLGQ
jgi:DNA-binding PadR family transcriptional regulator